MTRRMQSERSRADNPQAPRTGAAVPAHTWKGPHRAALSAFGVPNYFAASPSRSMSFLSLA